MINARLAKNSDSKIIYDWRNDELTRQMSHETDFLKWNEHREWYKSLLKNPTKFLLICEYARSAQRVAVVRFDIEITKALISINMSPAMRGQRMAKPCLQSAINFFSVLCPTVNILIAEVKTANTASQRTFESVGFVCVKNSNGTLSYEFEAKQS